MNMNNYSIKTITQWLNFSRKKIYSLTLEFRKSSKSFIVTSISESFYLVMSISFILLIAGFSVSLQWKYKNQFISYFVKNNFPALGQAYQKLSWETFENIIKKQIPLQNKLDFINQNSSIKSINIYSDVLLIKLKNYWQNLINQNYVGIVLINKDFNKTLYSSKKYSLVFARKAVQMGEKNCSYPIVTKTNSNNTFNTKVTLLPIEKIDSKNSRFEESMTFQSVDSKAWLQKWSTSFDEIPSKLESSVSFFDKLQHYTKQISPVIYNKTKSVTKGCTSSNTFDKYSDFDFSKILNKNISIFNWITLQKDKKSEKIIGKNFLVKNHQSVFLLKNKTEAKEKKYDQWLKIQLSEESENILQILNDLRKQNLNLIQTPSSIQPRLMSGYNYPDLDKQTLQNLFLQEFYKNWYLIFNFKSNNVIQKKFNQLASSFEISLPPSFAYRNSFLPSIPVTPKVTSSFQVVYRSISFDGLDTLKKIVSELEEKINPNLLEIIPVPELIYDGPGIFKKEETNDINVINRERIKNWAFHFFGPNNLLNDRQQNFFGKKSLLRGERKTKDKLLAALRFTSDHSENDRIALAKASSTYLHPIASEGSELHSTNSGASSCIKDAQQDVKQQKQENHSEKSYLQWSLLKKPFKNKGMTIKSFFNSNKSAKLLEPHLKNKNTHVLNYALKFNLNKNRFFPLTSFQEKEAIIYLQPHEWGQIFKAQISQALKNETNLAKLQIALPSIILNQPKEKNIEWPLTQLDFSSLNDLLLKNKKFFGEPQNLIWGKKQNIEPELICHYSPWTQGFLLESSLKKNFSTGVYQKIFTLFEGNKRKQDTDLHTPKVTPPVMHLASGSASNMQKDAQYTSSIFTVNENRQFNKKKTFHESWEPLTSTSWMLFYKLCFALWLQEIAKDFYKKYGKEILLYVVNLLAALGFDAQSIIEELGLEENQVRVIKKIETRFQDIAGINGILPELSEIVWFLRNSGRGSKIPKGILLVGPPGTGKTYLVQALAGEAQVPIVVQSASSLSDFEQKQSGSQRLKTVFDQARELSPCILFMDEIDTLGESRENVMSNPMGADQLLESIEESNFRNINSFEPFIPNPKIENLKSSNLASSLQNNPILEQGVVFGEQSSSSSQQVQQIMQSHQQKRLLKQQRLGLLMQFLVEMDGLRSLQGVIVIGATNRPSVLDPALTRPGRFEKILDLNLPGKQKRIEILKLYTKNIGDTFGQALKMRETDVFWDYLANRTLGLSAADLSAAINQSSLQAIMHDTKHTLETIEYGIESISRYNYQKPKLNSKKYQDSFLISRLAYYQASKAVVQKALPLNLPIAVLTLWPEPLNESLSFQSLTYGLNKEATEMNRRIDLESRLILLHSGKAGELLFLFYKQKEIQKNEKFRKKCIPHTVVPQYTQQAQQDLYQSDLGIEELTMASGLANSMITTWYFYSNQLAFRKYNLLLNNQNDLEISDPMIQDFFIQLASNHEVDNKNELDTLFQNYSIISLWQHQIQQQSRLVDPSYAEWYRLFLPDPAESERNEEWIPSDEYYQAGNSLKNMSNLSKKGSLTWNDLYLLDRDYIYHGLISNCLNKAFFILDQNRELLDYFADHLVRFKILRQHEINEILRKFQTHNVNPFSAKNSIGISSPLENILKKHEENEEKETEFKAIKTEESTDHNEETCCIEDLKNDSILQSVDSTAIQSLPKKVLRGKKPQNLQTDFKGFSKMQDKFKDDFDKKNELTVSPLYCIQESWGRKSRKSIADFIDFDFIVPYR